MDNINFHKSCKVKILIEYVKASILFLSTYRPDLNPIEHYWFKLKNDIKKTAETSKAFFNAELKHNLLIILDEFAFIANISYVRESAGYLVGYKLQLLTIFQNMS